MVKVACEFIGGQRKGLDRQHIVLLNEKCDLAIFLICK